MPRDRQRRNASSRVYLITGVDQNERKSLGKQIQTLGAIYDRSEHFHTGATHVVCGKLTRSEKFLGALSLGRWVVRPDYITASTQAGKWLDEVEYEWSSLGEAGHDQMLAAAAKRNRWRVSISTEQIFTDWRTAVVLSDVKRQGVFKRLLAFGGARVYDVKLPAKNPDKTSMELAYLFVDASTAKLAQSLRDRGVMCLSSDYISDCIVMDPQPGPFDYVFMGNYDGQSPPPSAAHSPDSTDCPHNDSQNHPSPSFIQLSPLISSDNNDKLVFSQTSADAKSSVASACNVGDRTTKFLDSPFYQDNIVMEVVDVSTDDDVMLISEEGCQGDVDAKTSVDQVFHQSKADSVMVSSEDLQQGVKEKVISAKFPFHDNNVLIDLVDVSIDGDVKDVKPVVKVGSRKLSHKQGNTDACAQDVVVISDDETAVNDNVLLVRGDQTPLKLECTEGSVLGDHQQHSSEPVELDSGTNKVCSSEAHKYSRPSPDTGQRKGLTISLSVTHDSQHHRDCQQIHRSSSLPSRVDSQCLLSEKTNQQPCALGRFSGTDKKTRMASNCPKFQARVKFSGVFPPGDATPSLSQQCPVVLTAVPVTASSTASSSAPAAPQAALSKASPALSKSTRHKGDGITVNGVKTEMSQLKTEVTKGRTRILGTPVTPRKRQQSLTAWFSPTGKENPSKSAVSAKETVQRKEKKVQGSKTHTGPQKVTEDSDTNSLKHDGHNYQVTITSAASRSNPHVEKDPPLPEVLISCSSSQDRTPKPSVSKSTSHPAVLLSAEGCRDSTSSCLDITETPIGALNQSLSKSINVNHATDDLMKTLGSGLTKNSELSLNTDNRSEMLEQLKDSCNHDHHKDISATSDSVLLTDLPVEKSSSSSSSLPSCVPVSLDRLVGEATLSECVRKVSVIQVSSDDVLSDKSLNRRRNSERKRNHTVRMNSFIESVHQKRKLRHKEKEASSSPSLDMFVIKTPTKNLPSRRRKTIRGLCQKLTVASETETCPSEEQPETANDVNQKPSTPSETSQKQLDTLSDVGQKITAPHETSQEQPEIVTSVSDVGAQNAFPSETALLNNQTLTTGQVGQELAKQPALTSSICSAVGAEQTQSGFLYPQGLCESSEVSAEGLQESKTSHKAAGSSSSASTQRYIDGSSTQTSNPLSKPNTVRPSTKKSMPPPIPKTSFPRWRLSHVTLPGHFDLTQGAATSIEVLMSKSHIPEWMGHMVSSCLDENYFQSAVAMAMSAARYCPTVEMLQRLVTVVQEAGSWSLVNKAYGVLRSWVDQFPPVTSALRSLYESGLGLDNWETFRQILQNAVKEAEKAKEGNTAPKGLPTSRMVLRLIIAVLEKNFLYFAHNCCSRQKRHSCLVLKCLWSSSDQAYPNARTRDLLHFLETALGLHDSSQACWQELMQLVSMAAQCCHLADNGWQWSAGGQVERCSSAIVTELIHTITGAGLDSRARLQQVLSVMYPPWLLRQVCASLLDNYDDYLVPGGLTSGPLTWQIIVSKYFFLLPRLRAQKTSDNLTPRKMLKKDIEVRDENEAPVTDPKLTAEKINKKNCKGESQLHRAAISNNISKLKQMLRVPGVDVNCQDHAGWTPLHEACNHGNMECVKLLLTFVPSATTIDSFFRKGIKMRRVDPMLSNKEGITALHDAVNVNQVSIVKLLLKYGGPSLLNAKTMMGLTAFDLAKTEEMRQVLTRGSADLNVSQEAFSQDLDGHDRESMPSSFMYSEVLDSHGSSTQLSASLEESRKYLTLLTQLLRAQLQVQREQQRLQDGSHEGLERREEKEARFHMQCLQRHMKKITTEDVFACLSVQLGLIETLLSQC